MSYNPQNPNGQATMANSSPVTIASDQSSIPVAATLQTGSAAIGKLTANSGVTIGAVEIAAAQTLATVTNLATIGTSITPGTSAAHLGKAEDAGHTTGDTGVMMLAVRESTPVDLSAGNTNGDYEPLQVDANGALWASLATLIAGEDLTNNVLKVEERFTNSGVMVGDTTVKSGAGFLHTITIAPNDSAPTAGSLIVYDNTTTGSGTQLFNMAFTTTYFVPFTVTIDASFGTGLTFDFTTTGDVNVFCSYR